jgi:hypothetical protein
VKNWFQSLPFKCDLQRYTEGAAAWDKRIKPAMIAAVVSSLKCAVDMIENRKNSFDIYGGAAQGI